MARISITSGRVKFWYLCSGCTGSDVADTAAEIAELAQQHLKEAHANGTHRVEMDADHLAEVIRAHHQHGEADTEGNLA